MGKISRDRGIKFERQCVNALKAHGYDACRVPLSGAHGGKFAGDVLVPLNGHDLQFECKISRALPAYLYDWLEGNNGVFCRADRKPILVVQTLDEWVAR